LLSIRRHLPIAALAIAIAALYFYNLNGVGVLGPDEPRYTAIGRAMAQTGDLVTPKLWGRPWFEKPPLLYWLTAIGTAAGLGPDLCGRLPVALLSLLFLGLCFSLVKREFGWRAAGISAALLATSAGWIAFSSFCLTDLPLAVFFSLAVLLPLPLLRYEPDVKRLNAIFLGIGLSLGLAALAKGLVPIALTLPFFWFLRRYWRKWWLTASACLLIALPWYWTVYARNGFPFIEEFFLKHHFQRLYSASLAHVQPFYYYLPVFLGAVFPWTPLLGLLAKRNQAWDRRRSFLLAVVAFGFFFFSLSRNKLPGYLLPLLPSFFVLLGSQFEKQRIADLSRPWLLPSAALIASIPLLAPILTGSLALGRITFPPVTHIAPVEAFYVGIPLVIVMLPHRFSSGLLLVLCMALEGVFLKTVTYPVIDAQISPRSLWRSIANIADQTCDGGTDRDWIYGLNYYRGEAYPACNSGKFRYRITTHGHETPDVERLN
jgi:4-amino-4-deoxy-L-arabinose transferase-like glycosyltransferase